MARDLQQIEALVELDEPARRALASPLRPIVLCPTRGGAAVAPAVAPGLDELGVMLPYTPLHHLLLRDGPELLVMTSGNLAEEPIAKDNPAALERLAGIADVFLLHDREIHTRADDSVVRMVAGKAQPVRRSRGHVPDPIELGFTAPPVLAVGANLKNAVCMTRGGEAYLSPHVGDLDHLETFAYFREVIGKLTQLLGVHPEVVAFDLHPDYVSTRWALESGLRREPVQHHHAHLASCLAEHGRSGPSLGVAFDGTGCGPTGELWGGEFLLADLAGFQRLGHLRPLALAGGEAALREPWRPVRRGPAARGAGNRRGAREVDARRRGGRAVPPHDGDGDRRRLPDRARAIGRGDGCALRRLFPEPAAQRVRQAPPRAGRFRGPLPWPCAAQRRRRGAGTGGGGGMAFTAAEGGQ